MEEYTNLLALTDALLSVFHYEGQDLVEIPYTPIPEYGPPAQEDFHLLNGSDVVMEVCKVDMPACVTNSSK
jgi:hypothetical protein